MLSRVSARAGSKEAPVWLLRLLPVPSLRPDSISLSVERYNNWNHLALAGCDRAMPFPVRLTFMRMEQSRFDAAPLIAFIAAKKMNYGTKTEG